MIAGLGSVMTPLEHRRRLGSVVKLSRWLLALPLFFAQAPINDSIPAGVLVRNSESAACRAVSPGVATGVVFGRVLTLQGAPIARARAESRSFIRLGDGGVRSNDVSEATTSELDGSFFLALGGGPLCMVRVAAPGFEEATIVVEPSTRLCVQVGLRKKR